MEFELKDLIFNFSNHFTKEKIVFSSLHKNNIFLLVEKRILINGKKIEAKFSKWQFSIIISSPFIIGYIIVYLLERQEIE